MQVEAPLSPELEAFLAKTMPRTTMKTDGPGERLDELLQHSAAEFLLWQSQLAAATQEIEPMIKRSVSAAFGKTGKGVGIAPLQRLNKTSLPILPSRGRLHAALIICAIRGTFGSTYATDGRDMATSSSWSEAYVWRCGERLPSGALLGMALVGPIIFAPYAKGEVAR